MMARWAAFCQVGALLREALQRAGFHESRIRNGVIAVSKDLHLEVGRVDFVCWGQDDNDCLTVELNPEWIARFKEGEHEPL